ncbi:hypothetical protein Tco_0955821 [Tanacetum coccineum]|uniref:Uncharacterized protein n=1 Tax=Tanacetum coccineum TaxID=301880 RepID=A0ABQ5E8C1_9ASTR
MVLQTERYPGGYHQNNYSAYQGPNGSYSNFQDVAEQTTPYSGYPNMSSYSSTQAQQYQSAHAAMAIPTTGNSYHGNPTQKAAISTWGPTRSGLWEPTRSRAMGALTDMETHTGMEVVLHTVMEVVLHTGTTTMDMVAQTMVPLPLHETME